MTATKPDTKPVASTRGAYLKLPKGIWVLGFVSLFMDVSSELVHSLLPVFMTTVLGASLLTVGVVEGVAEAAAMIIKVFSGAISDYFGKRKLLALLGYSLGAASKPFFPLAVSMTWVFGARLVDRIGKGIRGAPRDALVADISPDGVRGAAYGLRQALDSVGAFIGPLLAIVFMYLLHDHVKSVLWLAVAPAFLSVLLLAAGVDEPHSRHATASNRRLLFINVRQLHRRYWIVVTIGAVFTLARFSEAFLILRALDVGLSAGYVPLIMVVMNIVYSAFAYPAGAAADRVAARTLLVFGLLMLIIADIILALATGPGIAILGAAFWGLHMAFTQGLLAKLVADTAPAGLRGTAFGVFNLICGGAVLIASVVAGGLWNTFGAPATFIAGAIFAALAATGMLLYHPGKYADR